MSNKLFCPTCHDRLSDAEDEINRLTAMLKDMEWNGRTFTGTQTYRCPWCGGAKPDHTHGCALAACTDGCI